MITCVPFLVGLIIYSGIILISLFNLIRRKTSGCKEVLNQQGNISNIITSIIIISLVYVLCVYKYEKVAWAVILIPLFLSFILFLVVLNKIRTIPEKDIKDIADALKRDNEYE